MFTISTYRVAIAASALVAASVVAFGSAASSVPRAGAIRPDAVVKCASPNPCQTYSNTSKGAGVSGTSVGGVGVTGSSTNFNGVVGAESAVYPKPYPTGIFFGRSGVWGEDVSTDSIEQGVLGTSLNGAGVSGTAVNNIAVFGYTSSAGTSQAASGSGVYGLEQATSQPDFNIATTGWALNGTGVLGRTRSEGTVPSDLEAGVLGVDQAKTSTYNLAVAGYTTNGTGGFFQSKNGTAVIAYSPHGIGLAVQAEGTGTFQSVLNVYSANGEPLIFANGPTKPAMSLDSSGNMILRGTLTQHGNPPIVQRSATGQSYVAYSPIVAEATIEDVGEAAIVNGAANVRLDPALASTMDLSKGYVVFVQPEGMIKGSLCVVSRTASGFSVRESGGGRSSLAFAYRIVGRPFGSGGLRLPLAGTAQSPLYGRIPNRSSDGRALIQKAEAIAQRRPGVQ